MKVISNRISILKKDTLLSIVILPHADKRRLFILFLWLFAWTVCGLVVFFNYFNITDSKMKLFIIIYLSFWAYFEFNIVRVFLWKKYGKEKLWIQEGILNYQKEVNNKGKVHQYGTDLISKLRFLELSRTSFSDTFNQSFWVKGGERLEFTTPEKIIRLGMQINDEEARTILNEVNRFIKNQ